MTYATTYNRLLGIGTFAIAVLAAAMPLAHARNAYPPDWNVQKDVPKPVFEFIPGMWNDIQRYWPDQTSPGRNPSRAMEYPKIIYQITPGSDRYHSIQ